MARVLRNAQRLSSSLLTAAAAGQHVDSAYRCTSAAAATAAASVGSHWGDGPSVSSWPPQQSPRRSFHHSASTAAGQPQPTAAEPEVDPFALVADELRSVSERMRKMVITEVPALEAAADYFFKMGAQGKRFRPTILLLMASALPPGPHATYSAEERRYKQQRIAEITEMIHVASLLHDDVIDEAQTRRGVSSLNAVVGNKLAILAGDFLLARSSVTLASLKNVEVITLLSQVIEDLVTGEIMQMTAHPDLLLSLDHYTRKTYYKTASLIANSAKSIAIFSGQPPEVCSHVYDFGKHLGLAFQIVDDILDFTGSSQTLGKPAHADIQEGIATAPVIFAAEQIPALQPMVTRRFKHDGDVGQALAMVERSNGIERAQQLAVQHARLAAEAVASLPPTDSAHANLCRQGLFHLTELVLTRHK
eukprot:jgi/Chlat1/1993/Chrsp158S02295